MLEKAKSKNPLPTGSRRWRFIVMFCGSSGNTSLAVKQPVLSAEPASWSRLWAYHGAVQLPSSRICREEVMKVSLGSCESCTVQLYLFEAHS